VKLTFEVIEEDVVGPRWRQQFQKHWPAYQGWFLRGGLTGRPTYTDCRRALRKHMPQWERVWEQMVDAAGGGDIEARFLSLWCPPAYIAGCSQAVWMGAGGTALLRNYDFAPTLLEGTWLSTRWTGQRVLAMSDCLCGVLDGMNESGLAASLTFGGRKTRGEGFGIPLVMRYLLEQATTVREASAMLARIPVHMTYTVTLADRLGDCATVFVAPDRQAEIVPMRGATNHQHAIEWPEHAKATNTVARGIALGNALRGGSPSLEGLITAMLSPPLYQTSYEKGYGTLYSAVYRPQALSVELVWPNYRWMQHLNNVQEGSRSILLGEAEALAASAAAADRGLPGILESAALGDTG
jgi:predicted choloylglycine hydrolase